MKKYQFSNLKISGRHDATDSHAEKQFGVHVRRGWPVSRSQPVRPEPPSSHDKPARLLVVYRKQRPRRTGENVVKLFFSLELMIVANKLECLSLESIHAQV
jgi:hypothetical protein